MRLQLTLYLPALIAPLACAKQRDPAELDVVRIAVHSRIASSALHIADEEGFFRDEGIRLEFVETTRSTQAMPVLDRGDIDAIIGAPSVGLYSALAKGAHFRIVADRAYLDPDGCAVSAIMGRHDAFPNDSPTASQLRGKRFSINPAGTVAYTMDMYLKSVGLADSDINVVKLSEGLEAQAFETNALDGMHVSEPYLSRLRERGHRVLAVTSRLAPGAHTSVLLFGPSILNRPELAQRFMNAYLRGSRRYSEGSTPRNIEIIAKRLGYDTAMLRNICLPKTRTDGELNLDWLLRFQEWAVEKGHLDKVVGREAGVDLSFARRAAAMLDAEGVGR